jgi:Tfp pilus assembly protein PilP
MRLLLLALFVLTASMPASTLAASPAGAETSKAKAADEKAAGPVPQHAATEVVPGQPGPGSPFSVSSGPYSYNADGRRDPFQTLLGTGGDSRVPPKPPAAGIAGIRVDELAVRGIMQARERLVAMIVGPDNRTYLIHQGDKLADGAVKSITPQGLVLVQDVSDPSAKEKTREVRKLLRSPEDDKE